MVTRYREVLRPGGTFDNSPAIHRWVGSKKLAACPVGTIESVRREYSHGAFVYEQSLPLYLQHEGTSASHHGDFAWQEGYGAFSIGVSQVQDTIAYIGSQAEHHRQKTFQEEFLAFLNKHGIEYDERYIWD